MVLFLFFPFIAGVMAAIVVYCAARWGLGRRVLRYLVWLVLAAAAVVAVYGLLRLTGIVLLPGDNTWSVNFFDASWRDDGVRLLLLGGAPLAGTVAALLRDRKDK